MYITRNIFPYSCHMFNMRGKAVDVKMESLKKGAKQFAAVFSKWMAALKSFIWQRRSLPANTDPTLLDEIREVRARLCCVQQQFDQLSDGDLLEACIYEMEALQAQYRFLLRQAKRQGLRETPFPHSPM